MRCTWDFPSSASTVPGRGHFQGEVFSVFSGEAARSVDSAEQWKHGLYPYLTGTRCPSKD